METCVQVRDRWRQDPLAFWLAATDLIDWDVAPQVAIDESNSPLYRWFPDGQLNTSVNAVDRHVAAGLGDKAAIIYDSPLTNSQRTITYSQLLDLVERCAGMLADLGVQRGDRVLLYLPMIPETIAAMLGCARLGAVHSVVFGGFAAAELAHRIDDATPTVVITASCGVEPHHIVEYVPLLEEALRLASHEPAHVVLIQRDQHRATAVHGWVDWHESMADATPHAPVMVNSTDPLYILYTSGTTGRPKGIVRDNGGHAVAMAWSFPNIYGMSADDVWWSASDVGWVVGHSYIVYAPLISGATTVLYEGKPIGTPDAGAFWRVIEEHGVSGLFTAPTAIRAIKKVDPNGELLRGRDISSLRSLFLAGERLDPDTFAWATNHLGVPIVDNWWQTETGWPIASTMRGLAHAPIKIGSASRAVPGYDLVVLDNSGTPVAPNVDGAIAIALPMPPGTLPTLWGDDQRYIDAYLIEFPGYYSTGDGGFLDEDGFIFVMGRTDDVINVAGHRLSTGSLEAVVATHPDVAECAVVGVFDEIKGQVPLALVVVKTGSTIDPVELAQNVVEEVRRQVGPVAVLKEVIVVPALPKTRSGKILRKTMRGIADGRPEPVPSTIEDVGVLEEIIPLLRR